MGGSNIDNVIPILTRSLHLHSETRLCSLVSKGRLFLLFIAEHYTFLSSRMILGSFDLSPFALSYFPQWRKKIWCFCNPSLIASMVIFLWQFFFFVCVFAGVEIT